MVQESQSPGNLPALFTSFVGRQAETVMIGGLLRSTRLLTLTGPGGVGKTRLALETATAAAGAFPDGAWLVDLAPVREPAAVAGVAASTLGVPDQPNRPVAQYLAEYLAHRRALIMLDNCEHLASPCAELVEALLSAAPDLRILATSRHMLDLTGEYVFVVPPLCPWDATSLLRDRAAAVRPGFEINDANGAEVSRVCAELDGLPLAIEMAASRLRTFTIRQMADRLADRFTLLTGGSRTALPHQRTLRGMIDWSYELCSADEQLLWNRLSVFAGGFSLEAAETVCSGNGLAQHEVPDLLDRLVTQSVVVTLEAEGLPRYRLLEIIRQYGRERLATSGEEEELVLRHRDFFLTLAERVDEGWFGPGQVGALARLRVEHTNLLAALESDTDLPARLSLAAALRWHWCAGGFLGEGRRQFDRVLSEQSDDGVVTPSAWATTWYGQDVSQQDPVAIPPRRTTTPQHVAPARCRALWVAAWVAQTQGDLAAADRWLDEAEALGEELGDGRVLAYVRGFRGVSADYRGRPQESVVRYEEARATLALLGDEVGAVAWLFALACILAYAADTRASATGRDVVAVSEARGEHWGRAQVLMALGHEAWGRGDRGAAEELTRSALENMLGFNDHAMVARMLELLAWATAADGRHTRAAGLLGAARALWRGVGTSVAAFGPRMAEYHEHCEQTALRVLGRTRYAQLFTEGERHDTPALAVPYALGSHWEGAKAEEDPCPLSCREREVAALVAEGMSNRQIASTLSLSPRTVDRHVQNILGKLGFGSRARIASWWTTARRSAP
ncbi:LuxR C-terminal-related transcriptional regulator [Streptomyces sp. NPDC058464]|uniref:LuxR C-terminal-related transcriptional regulator n=1 Tax=Streptomyces sp. NPDC058464 TaxID=3346511 RepID=UPI00364F712C